MVSRRFRNSLLLPLFLTGSICLVGCGDDTDPEAGFDTGARRDTSGVVSITQGSHGKAFENVSFDVTSPTDEATVEGDSIDVSVMLSGVELKSPTPGEGTNSLAYSMEGQHIHVIIDNEPYMAKYDTTFRVGVTPGEHTLIAFPSRSWHESVKNPGAVVARRFSVGEQPAEWSFDPTAPTLVYSRPKGEYAGKDAAKIMLDFYLLNVELSPDGYRVIASVDGEVLDTLDAWVPYFITGLENGEHTIGLKLIDADGNEVQNGPYGTIERTITVLPKKDEADGGAEGSEHEHDRLEEDIIDVGRNSQGL